MRCSGRKGDHESRLEEVKAVWGLLQRGKEAECMQCIKEAWTGESREER
jgi:hypothetical protein